MIETLVIENFQSILYAEIPLQPLTVLVGPNNAGKTNVLRAMSVLSQAVANGLDKPVTIPDARNEFLSRNTTARELRIGAQTRYGWLQVRLSWEAGNLNGTIQITEDREGKRPRIRSTVDDRLSDEVKATPIFSFELSQLRQPCGSYGGQRLTATGQGLAGVLFEMQGKNPAKWEALNEEFHEYVPSVKRINFAPVDGALGIVFWEESLARSVAVAEMSDGIVLLTGLLAVRYSVEAGVILLEEPERGIHPRRLEEVTTSLRALASPDDSSKAVQVVMTSHSPYFLDRFKDSPESVLVVDRGADGNTVVRPLTDRLKELPKLKDESLGDLWYSGVLGGVPPAA